MRDFAQKNLYELVQQSVLGRRRGVAARAYLRELADAFEQLASAYRASSVVVDYSSPGFVEAYRLHYMPHYAHTAFQALASLPIRFYDAVANGTCVVGVAAAGPLPEAIALLERCATAGVTSGRIELHAFDVAAETWSSAAIESVAIARSLNPAIEVALRYQQMDFRDVQECAVPEFDLLTFQHCVNEFAKNGMLAPGSRQLVRGVVSGGALLFSDLTQYGSVVATIQRLERTFDDAGWIALARFDPSHAERSPFWRVPYETYFGFYEFAFPEEGALQRQPRRFSPRRNLNYSWSMWSRP